MAPMNDTREKNDVKENQQPMQQQNTSKKNQTRRRVLAWLVGGAVLLGFAVGIPYYMYIVSHESTDDAFLESRIISVSPRVSGHVARVYVADNQKVAAGDLLVELDSRDFKARLNAARASLEAMEAAARSRHIEVDLTTITSTAVLDEAKAAVTAATAMVQNAKALVSGAKSQRDEAQAQVDLAKAALRQAQAELTAEEAKYQQASQDRKRMEEMAESRTVSQQQLDHAVTAERIALASLTATRSKVDTQQSMLQRAEASLKAASDNVRQSQAQVAARQAQLGQTAAKLDSAKSAPVQVSQSTSRAEASKADVERARAEVEQATLNLSYTQIHAAADGYVTKKNVEAGAFVQVGQALMAIVTPEIWVTANFKETQLTRMRPGLPVEVTVDAFPDMTLHGRVDSIQRGTGSRFSLLPPENATGNFIKVVQRVPVKIVFDRPEELTRHLLVPGMSVVPKVNVKADIQKNGEGQGARKSNPQASADNR